eukprot:scaffold14739_cov107-Isochrysis_galbana.AAC.6
MDGACEGERPGAGANGRGGGADRVFALRRREAWFVGIQPRSEACRAPRCPALRHTLCRRGSWSALSWHPARCSFYEARATSLHTTARAPDCYKSVARRAPFVLAGGHRASVHQTASTCAPSHLTRNNQ